MWMYLQLASLISIFMGGADYRVVGGALSDLAIIGASLSSPHTRESGGKNSACTYVRTYVSNVGQT